jgi:hypothetical protein
MMKLEDEMPVELKLEMLVDAELPEVERRELLLALDREPGRWRELSMRFLERQVEKQAARQWIGTAAISPPIPEIAGNHPFPTSVPARNYLRSIAAGLLVAAVSAVVTIYAVRQPTGAEAGNGAVLTETAGPIATDIPGAVLGSSQSLRVSVPVTNVLNVDQPFFPKQQAQPGDDLGSKRSVVIQADASGNPVAIPVNPLRMKFY